MPLFAEYAGLYGFSTDNDMTSYRHDGAVLIPLRMRYPILLLHTLNGIAVLLRQFEAIAKAYKLSN